MSATTPPLTSYNLPDGFELWIWGDGSIDLEAWEKEIRLSPAASQELRSILANHFPAPLPAPAAPTSAKALPAPAMGAHDLAPVRELVGACLMLTKDDPITNMTVRTNWSYYAEQLREKAQAADAALRAAQTPDSILTEMTFSKTV